ncbi:MAG: cupredoxin domain-containing protein [Deltaproteobacteria bacterium]
MTRMFIAAALAAFSTAAAAQAVAIPVTLTEWKIEMARDTVPAGPVIFRLSNKGTITHGFYVRGEGVEKGSREIPAGESASLTVTFKPGTYELFCPMSDNSHKTAGMVRKLVVTGGTAPAPPKKPGA